MLFFEKKKKVYFFIVDHKLRKNSTLRQNCKKNLKYLILNSEILTIKNMKKSSNLQSFARENRYKLIIKKKLK